MKTPPRPLTTFIPPVLALRFISPLAPGEGGGTRPKQSEIRDHPSPEHCDFEVSQMRKIDEILIDALVVIFGIYGVDFPP